MIGAFSFQSVIALLRRANTWVAAQTFQALISAQAGIAMSYLVYKGMVVSNLIVKTDSAVYTANANLTVAIPRDNTIPQSTEGTEIISLSYMPLRIGDILEIECAGIAGAATSSHMTMALFDGSANAIGVSAIPAEGSGYCSRLAVKKRVTVASLTPIIFSVRVGAGSGAMRMNGTDGAMVFGGIAETLLTVKEYAT